MLYLFFILLMLAAFAIGYRAGWQDGKQRLKDQQRIGASLLSDVPEWVRRRTTEAQQ